MAPIQSFRRWLQSAPRERLRGLVAYRRDLVRSDSSTNARFANLASSRQAVAVGLETLSAESLHAATRAASIARAHATVPAEVFADADSASDTGSQRVRVLTELADAGLIWPAAGSSLEADSYCIQPEASTLLPTSAAQLASPPWWLEGQAPMPPGLPESIEVPAALAGNSQAAAVTETMSGLYAVIRVFAQAMPSQLHRGGVGKRDAQQLAHRLDLDPPLAFLLIELASMLNLINVGGDDLDPVWLPTAAAQAFTGQERAQSYLQALTAWLRSDIDITHIVAGRTPNGERIHLLSSGSAERLRPAYSAFPSVRPATAYLRWRILELTDELTGQRPGPSAADSLRGDERVWAVSAPDLIRTAQFRHPLLPAFNPTSVRQVLAEAEFLGLLCSPLAHPDAYGLTPLGRLVLGSLEERMTDELSPVGYALERVAFDDAACERLTGMVESLLPELQETVVIQSDLTAVATGPLAPHVAARLERVAQVETRGQGTVYRFSAETLRRAYEAGMSAGDIRTLITQVSSTRIPDPLEFLISDTEARLHRVHVAAARSSIIVDDPADLDEIMDDPLFAAAQLLRVAPTVALGQVSDARLRELLELHGTPTLALEERRRAPQAPVRKQAAPVQRRTTRLDEIDVDAIAQAISRPLPESDSADPLGRLREAMAARRAVSVTFATGQGGRRAHTLVPRTLAAGRLVGALAPDFGREVTLPVSRIIRVQAADAAVQGEGSNR